MRACFIVLLALPAACGRSGADAEISALLDEAEAAAEARQTGYFRSLLSDDYVDARGNRKEDLVNRIRAYFLLNSDVEIVDRIQEITLHGDDAATVVLQTALVGRGQGRGLLGVDGDLFRLELELLRDRSDWHVVGANWERLIQ